MKKLAFIILCMFCFTLSAYSQFRVNVEVKGNNSATKDEVYSYISRELRSLKDVEIVDVEDASYILTVLVTEGETDSRKVIAVSFSLLRLLRNYNFISKLPVDEKRIFSANKYGGVDFQGIVLMNKEKLSKAIEEEITQMDIKAFSAFRKLEQKSKN